MVFTQFCIEYWHGGKIHRITPSIIHLMRGQIFNIETKTFFTMGGANSQDKEYRKVGISWWPQELPSNEEFDEAMRNLYIYSYKVDYILTHCASNRIQSQIHEYYKKDRLTTFLDEIVENSLHFKHWYFGHYHVDLPIDSKHTALYNNKILIK